MRGEDRIIVALDATDRTAFQNTLDALKPDLRIVKIGSVLFSAEGPAVLKMAAAESLRIFLDLKFHDIPNTVAGAVGAACRLAPLDFLTLHASGGSRMIQAARKAVDDSGTETKPKLLAVTVLTSLSADELRQVGFANTDPGEMVVRLAKIAVASGADGIVCSPKEVGVLRASLPRHVTLVVPGIRSGNSLKDDQERTACAKDAIQAGADYLVVGRPITGAKDPRAAFLDLAREADV